MSFKSQAKPDSQSGAQRFASAKCGASMSATRLMPHKRCKLPREPRVPCRASGIHKNRKFYVSHAFVATPRTCEFHICCARLFVPSVCCDPSNLRVPHLLRTPSVCCNPTDLQVPRLLRASCGARPPLLRPFRSLSAKRVLWCPWLATTHQIHVCCVPLMVPSVC